MCVGTAALLCLYVAWYLNGQMYATPVVHGQHQLLF